MSLGGALGEHGRPVHLGTAHEEVRDGGQQRLRLAPVVPQGRDTHRVLTGRLRDGAAECTAGAEFQEHRAAGGADAVGEADGSADVLHPVLRVRQLAGLREPARHVRHDRDGRLVPGQPGEGRGELRQHRLHQRRVESVRDGEALDPAALLTQLLRDGLDGSPSPERTTDRAR